MIFRIFCKGLWGTVGRGQGRWEGGEEGLAEATMPCKAVHELAKLVPSPEDAPYWDFVDYFFFLLNLPPLFQSAAACS